MENLFENFSTERFLGNLHYMWEGMLCIFIVIGVIMLSVYALGFIFKRFRKDKKEDN